MSAIIAARRALLALVLGVATSAASAQEAMYAEAATMPSPGTWVLREMVHVQRFGANVDAGIDQSTRIEAMTSLQYGLRRDWSLLLDVPLAWQWDDRAGGGDDYDRGVEDLDLMAKWRFYRHDSGGVDTVRAALMGGVAFASGDDADFSSMSANPMLGAVLTVVRGRHGLNQDLFFKLNTGGDADHNFGGEGLDDAVFHNTAWVYRLAPDRFTSTSVGAWYSTAELSGIYETNGDYELRGSVGLMYEARRWTFEAGLQLPVYDGARERAELDLGLGVGLRMSF